MVGLFGIFRRFGGIHEENGQTLKMMLSAMNPAPTNIVNTFFDENAAIGRVGLGVLNRTPQPVHDAGKRYFLFMDGQIFDYEVLKNDLQNKGFKFIQNTEEELVLNLFLQHDTDAVRYLKGVFIIIIYDSKTKSLYIMNSRYGLEYLYYYIDTEKMIFASSIKTLMATGLVPKRVNEKAIYDFLKFEFITGDETFFKDIKLFPYATVSKISGKESYFNRYWDYPKYPASDKYSDKDIDDLIERGSYLLKNAISKQLKKNINPGVTLSGGLDSRTISAYLTKQGVALNAFHAGGRNNGLETTSAKLVCNALNGKWNYYDLGAVDFGNIITEGADLSDGHISCNQFWLLDCIKKAKASNGVNYILDGFAMDILFQPLFIKRSEKITYSMDEKVNIINNTFGCEDDRFVQKFYPKYFHNKYLESTTRSVMGAIGQFGSEDISCLTQYFHFVNRARRFVFGMPMVNRSFIEYGFPGLDYDLFDFGLSLALDYRLKGELYRKIIIRDFPQLGRIPWPLTGLPLDRYDLSNKNTKNRLQHYLYYISRITNGRFEMLPQHDLNYRFRKDPKIREYFIKVLKDERTASRGLIDKKGIVNLIKHQDSGRNYIAAMQSIVTVELWYRNFIDSGGVT